MSSAMTNFLIAVGITSGICYALMTQVQNRSRRRSRAGGGDGFTGSSDGFTLGTWFSGDQISREGSGDQSGGSCSFSTDSSGGGGDCGSGD